MLAAQKRAVRYGLLSVGLKLHCLGEEELFLPLFEALGGQWNVLYRNVYKGSQAKFCMVLPPVGSADAAILLLECIEHYTGCAMFNNRNIQLQVCSPGRLTGCSAALHAIGFYLGSDTLRRYALEDFATTVSDDFYRRGKRIVIHDAGPYGEFDSGFAWWARTAEGLVVRPSLPFLSGRTDILVGPGSRADIANINLLATLLVHAQSQDGDGYWSALGKAMTRDLMALLERHMLGGLVEAPWVCADKEGAAQDPIFFSALQELTAYATGEVERLGRGASPSGLPGSADQCTPGGILHEMQALLAHYRAELTSGTVYSHGGGP